MPPVPLTIRIIFSGLIMMASGQNGYDEHVALLVEDSEHTTSILLAEATCVPLDGTLFGSECNPRDLTPYFTEVWVFNSGGPYILTLNGGSLTQGPVSRRRGRPVIGGKPVLHPSDPAHIEDVSWLPSVKRMVQKELSRDCLSGNIQQCKNARARFAIPTVQQGGVADVAACHLLHRLDLSIVRGVVDACEPMAAGNLAQPERVHRVEVEEDGKMVERTIANAFIAEVVIDNHGLGRALELGIVNPKTGKEDRVALQPNVVAGRQTVTLLVLNEPTGTGSAAAWYKSLGQSGPAATLPPTQSQRAHGSSRIGHFSKYCGLFDEPLDKCPQPVRKAGNEILLDVGICEAYFDCLDGLILNRVFQAALTPTSTGSQSPALDYYMFPHSGGECDSSGYP